MCEIGCISFGCCAWYVASSLFPLFMSDNGQTLSHLFSVGKDRISVNGIAPCQLMPFDKWLASCLLSDKERRERREREREGDE